MDLRLHSERRVYSKSGFDAAGQRDVSLQLQAIAMYLRYAFTLGMLLPILYRGVFAFINIPVRTHVEIILMASGVVFGLALRRLVSTGGRSRVSSGHRVPDR